MYGPTLTNILAKTGTAAGIPAGEAEIIGENENPIPAADDADARSRIIYQGLHFDDVLEVIFTRVAQDGTFYMAGSLDGTNFSRLSFRTLIDDTVISGVTGLALGTSARVLVKLPRPGAWQRIVAVRCGFFLAAADANAAIVVRHVAGR